MSESENIGTHHVVSSLTPAQQQAQTQVLETCLALADKGYLAGIGGNIALRIDDTHFAVTPSAADYYSMTDNDICILTLDELTEIHAPKSPSVEAALHAAVFAKRPDVTISLHTHQPIASAVTLLDEDIDVEDPELRALLGSQIKIAKYGPSGMSLLKNALSKIISHDNNAYLLRNHGVVCMADDIDTGIAQLAAVEKAATAHLRAAVYKQHGANPDNELADFVLNELTETLN